MLHVVSCSLSPQPEHLLLVAVFVCGSLLRDIQKFDICEDPKKFPGRTHSVCDIKLVKFKMSLGLLTSTKRTCSSCNGAPVCHVDAGKEQLTLDNHHFQLENTRGRFVTDTLVCRWVVLQEVESFTNGKTHTKYGFVVFYGSGKVLPLANAASISVPMCIL